MNSIDGETVVILTADLTEKKSDILKSKIDDPILMNNIENYYQEKLKPENIEVFERHNNVYITENGYYLAVYVRDIDSIVEDNDLENK